MKHLITCCALAALVATADLTGPFQFVSTAQTLAAETAEWPQWRGPLQNGVSLETGLIEHWDPRGTPDSNLLFKSAELAGRSTPIVMHGRLYTIVRADPDSSREGEKVVCADAKTGEVLWENRFNVYLSDVPAERIGWSCCVGDPATGRIYVQGVCGLFLCIDGETGSTLWSQSLHEQYGLLSTYGGRTNVPVLFEDLVITSAVIIGWGEMAKPTHRFLAFNKETGELVWFTGTRVLPYDTTYSTPTLAVIGGQAMMVFGSGDGDVWAFQPRTGQPIWNYSFSRRGLSVSPLVVGDTVFMGHSEENVRGNRMGGLVALPGNSKGDLSGKELWRLEETMVGKSTPLEIDGRIYAVGNGAKLLVLDAQTGKTLARKSLGGTMFSSPLYADGKIYVCTETRAWYILRPTDRGVEVLDRANIPRGEQCFGSPIVADGRIYVPTSGHLYCFGREDHQTASAPAPQRPQETPAGANDAPAHVQIVPCELLLQTGEQQTFTARLFNDRGQRLEGADLAGAEFSIEGPGTISKEGVYQAPETPTHAAAIVTCRVGEQKGTARIRIVPPLPWKFDFSDGSVPITWVGARYRHIPLDFDLYSSLRQQNPRAADLYVDLTTGMINGGRSELTFDQKPPRNTFTALLRYLGLEAQVGNVGDAQRELGPALEVLQQQEVIADVQWLEADNAAIELSLRKGPRQASGNGVMTKITTIPKGTRSRCWFGPPGLSNYTIQADVLGSIKNGKLPDIGLICQRYTMDLQGVSQKLQLRTWSTELRMAKTIPMSWQPNVWYTMKMTASVEDGIAHVRGKVWPRGETEPSEWTVESTDPSPNLSGSPGLFGNATDAEIFIDNITVTANGPAE